ncbi:alpha-hydroxy acid oxidase [Nocardioides marmorisolisilvae]|uniref:Alpha-hydroxy-acid oxidizing enzyme n=1 Tax=Nocardioides marmorisolisilvae TaxID=1542737 RepID=A0A3N0DUH5_9ACTN|nr:alpha-hydroxy acid oxidase [Nocardioides marmorisolisilvae]RNL79272.1 alpha-hydroxy-acid oxidizing enzyme [Nocardioides marmorisolisilvae]
MEQRWQDALVARAQERLPAAVFRYFADGAGDGLTTAEAEQAWLRVRLAPRVLTDVSRVDLSSEVLGATVTTPIAIAPSSLQRLAHPDGELAMARAAAATGTLLCVPSNAGTLFSEIGDTGATWWLQLYVPEDRSLIEPVLERAAAAGARAIAVTVDAAGTRVRADLDEALDEEAAGYRLNHDDPALLGPPGHAADLGPDDLARVARLTGLPVVVKGVSRADDALRSVQAGADAVWVSNHGGRQLDRTVATAQSLGAIRDQLARDVPVFVDGGVRSGLDVLAGLALGADAVFLGRLPLYGLAAGGEAGVVEVLERVREELESALRRAGCTRPEDARGLVANQTNGP